MKLYLLLMLLLSGLAMADDVEEPRWELLATLDKVQIRQYEPGIRAVTQLASSSDSSAGFRRLAAYIFGGNERSQSIAMTAPVQETLEEKPQMAFTMPAEYAMEDLPLPDDDSVSLHPIAGRTVAVIEFSGWATEGKIERNKKELMSTLERHKISTLGIPALNQYNPPWTPPFLRRNEIAVDVSWDDHGSAALGSGRSRPPPGP